MYKISYRSRMGGNDEVTPPFYRRWIMARPFFFDSVATSLIGMLYFVETNDDTDQYGI